MLIRYALTHTRNGETQHWRGLLRGYAVTPVMRMYVCAGMQAGACAWARACMRVCCVSAQSRNSLGLARVAPLHARATALHHLSFIQKKGSEDEKGAYPVRVLHRQRGLLAESHGRGSAVLGDRLTARSPYRRRLNHARDAQGAAHSDAHPPCRYSRRTAR